MNPRPRHPKKELERVIRLAEENGWRGDRPSATGYFRLRCPCGDHQTRVHLSPSDGNYALNLRKWLERQPCWKGIVP